VALKIQSPDIPHKTEAGGVRIGVEDRDAVGMAFDEIVANAGRHVPDAAIDGVLVQEMVSGGTEVILGVNNDPLFGPAIMFGLGGIFAEVLKDVTFRLAPVTRSEALDMIREIRAFKVLDGARGRPKADVAALADAIQRLSALAADLRDEVAELDVNPLFVLPAGQGVRAGDALIKPRSQRE
jgi:acyl-CoA synthetase (NDP forming)